MAGVEPEADFVLAARQKETLGDEYGDQGKWDTLREATRRGGAIPVFGKVFGVVLTIFRILFTFLRIRTRLDSKSIDPNRVYSTRDLAKMLEIERCDVIGLILSGKLKARKSGRNYHIVGRSIIRYLRG